jgi:hypothetical protein
LALMALIDRQARQTGDGQWKVGNRLACSGGRLSLPIPDMARL